MKNVSKLFVKWKTISFFRELVDIHQKNIASRLKGSPTKHSPTQVTQCSVTAALKYLDLVSYNFTWLANMYLCISTAVDVFVIGLNEP